MELEKYDIVRKYKISLLIGDSNLTPIEKDIINYAKHFVSRIIKKPFTGEELNEIEYTINRIDFKYKRDSILTMEDYKLVYDIERYTDSVNIIIQFLLNKHYNKKINVKTYNRKVIMDTEEYDEQDFNYTLIFNEKEN